MPSVIPGPRSGTRNPDRDVSPSALAPHPALITTDSQLAEYCQWLQGVSEIAFDTEFVSEGSYRPELCLVQVATAEKLFVIDPFSCGYSLSVTVSGTSIVTPPRASTMSTKPSRVTMA